MPACPHCHAENQAGNQFCLSCGKPLAAAGETDQTATLDDLLNAGVVCPQCDAYNDAGTRTCISCGAPLSGMTGYLHAVDMPPPKEDEDDDTEATAVEDRTATVPEMPMAPAAPTAPTAPQAEAGPFSGTKTPAEIPAAAEPPRRQTAQMHAATPQEGGLCPHCRASLPAGSQICLACGQRATPPAEAPGDGAAVDMSIRLRLVRGYGQEDATFPVGPAGVTVGRQDCTIAIADDPFLSPRHLHLRLQGGQLVAEDMGSLNGTFARVRGQAEVKQGAEFVSGNQRFCLLGLGGPTTDVRMPLSQDTRAYGGPPPNQLFVALRLNHADGAGRPLAGSVILRCGPVITVGKQDCDLSFPNDPAMSARQFELHLKPSGIRLVEGGASSGVFLRIGAPVGLQNGDELLVGDEVFRVEIG